MAIGKIILIVCLVSSAILGIVTAIYLKKPVQGKKADTQKEAENNHKKDDGIDELRNLLDIEGIKNGVIKTKSEGYRVIFSISSPDFELLSDPEQEIYEDNLRRFAISLNFGVQFYTTAQKVETSKFVRDVNDVKSNPLEIQPELNEYSKLYRDAIIQMSNKKDNYVRKSYGVISVDGIYPEKRAMSELERRIETVFSGLRVSRMKLHLLNSNQELQLLNDIFNKNKRLKISNLIDDGVLELYSTNVESSEVEKRLIQDDSKETA